MKEQSTGNIVRFTLDPANPPTLTAEEKERLEAMRDGDIDCNDIVEQSGKVGWHPGWHPDGGAAIRHAAFRDGLFVLDPEVLAFFKAGGDAPAEKIQAVLQQYVETHRKGA